MKRIVGFLVIVSLLIPTLMFSACGDGDSGENKPIDELISRFEKAIQDADVDDLLECCDPEVTGVVTSVLGFFGLDGDDMSDLLSKIMDLGNIIKDKLGNEEETQKVLKSLKLTPVDYNYSDKGTRCKVTVKYSYESDGDTETDTTKIDCVLRDDKWYVAVIL